MADYCYANTHHAAFFSQIDARNDGTKPLTVEINGEKWIKVPYNTGLSLFIPPIRNMYISMEVYMAVPPTDKGRWDFIIPVTQIYYGDSGSSYTMDFVKTDGDFLSIHGTKYNELPRKNQHKVFVHVRNDNGRDIADIISGNLTAKRVDWGRASLYRGMRIFCDKNGNLNPPPDDWAFYVRNIIISEKPISQSDQIVEIDVKSITGDGWYTSGGKSFTNKANQTATVQFDEAQLNEVLSKYGVKKFIYSGIIDREGDTIQNLYMTRNGETVSTHVDAGEQFVGASWDATGANPSTLTIETKGGVS